MKKILSLVAILAIVGSASAASLSWSIANVYAPGTTTAAENYAVYLFITQQSKDFGAGTTTISDVKTLIEKSGTEVVKDGEGKVTGIKNGTTTIDVAAAKLTSDKGSVTGATGYYGNFGAGDSLQAFAVIFDAADASAASNYIVTDIKSASWTSSSGAKTLGFGSQAPVNGVEKWTPVPEPSTAALALAGLALLLKRRRA